MSTGFADIADHLDAEARRALAAAVAAAELGQQSETGALHVLLALAERPGVVRSAVERLAVDPKLLVAFGEVTLARRKRGPRGLRPILEERLSSRLALAAARSAGRLLGPGDAAMAAVECGSAEVERVLGEFAIDRGALAAALDADGRRGATADRRPEAAVPARPAGRQAPAGERERAAGDQRPVPANLSPLATGSGAAPVPWTTPLVPAPGRPAVVGRSIETATVLAVLRQRGRRSPFLLGEPGSGRRTVLAEALARMVASGSTLRPVTLDLLGLLAGTRARGDMEERLGRLAAGLRAEAGSVLLCIPDASLIDSATPGVGLDETLADMVECHGLAIALVGSGGDLERLRSKAPRLASFLQPVPIDEPSPAELGGILDVHGAILAAHHGVAIAPGALAAAAELSGRHLREPALPARAIHLVDAAAAAVASRRGEPAAGGGRQPAGEAGPDDVAAVVAAWTRIPVTRLLKEEAERLRDLDATLRKGIKGQDDAVARVVRAVRRGRLGLRDARRPVGSFMFAGPTGVGKTELARKLAEALFDDAASLIRIDMSEFGERHMVARLLGAPPGYVDSEAGGVLTEAIRRRPYSVLLLDEMEKAHPDVHNLLLQVLDDGRLTDARGRTFDFTHCVVIMTTNVGGESVLHAGPGDDLSEVIRERLLERFRPEMLNRIDELVVLGPLGDEALRGIAEMALAEAAALAAPLGLAVTFAPGLAAWVVARRDAPEFGARPVRRVVRREVLDRLAALILDGGAKEGDPVVFEIVDGEARPRVLPPAAGHAGPAE